MQHMLLVAKLAFCILFYKTVMCINLYLVKLLCQYNMLSGGQILALYLYRHCTLVENYINHVLRFLIYVSLFKQLCSFCFS